MAFFECTIGGASGDGVALIVECDPSFAGSTITADNGEDVFTEICPSVSPYTVRFEGISTGTFTISGVSQGQTFATQFTVLDYETTLNPTPEGATVLPINDVQIWLHCANIWDKNYTTISQVLADTTTLLALVSSNNAVDYMARSTGFATEVCANQTAMGYIGNNNYCANKLIADATWLDAICNSTYFESVLNVKVPTMTSNTAPSGEVTTSSENVRVQGTSNVQYRIFTHTTAFYFADRENPSWFQYKFTSEKLIKFVTWENPYYTGSSDTYAPTEYVISGSNDGTNFTPLASGTRTTSEVPRYDKHSLPNNATKYLYIRVQVKNSVGTSYNGIGASGANFYGRE